MGYEYKYNSHSQMYHRRHHHYKSSTTTAAAAAATTTFLLPMLCRVSMKDVRVERSTSASISGQPSSPKVSCIDQVKRGNNKLIKRFFSGKNLSPAVAAAAATGGGKSSGREMIRMNSNTSGRKSRKVRSDDDDGNNNGGGVNVSELDPPLPVVKRVVQPPEVNLWNRRRSGGASSLNTLQIQRIHLPNNLLILPTTV